LPQEAMPGRATRSLFHHHACPSLAPGPPCLRL